MKSIAPPPANIVTRFDLLLNELRSELPPEAIVRVLTNILIRAAHLSRELAKGRFSTEQEYLVQSKGHFFYTDIPSRAAKYLNRLLDQSISAELRIVEFYDALRNDKKVQHTLLRDEIWDDTVTSMNGALLDLTEEDVGSLEVAIQAGMAHAITTTHTVLTSIKSEMFGDRDVVDRYLKAMFDVLASPTADELKQKLGKLASVYDVRMPREPMPIYDQITPIYNR